MVVNIFNERVDKKISFLFPIVLKRNPMKLKSKVEKKKKVKEKREM